VNGISFRSRAAGGVRVFNTAKGEQVVSVAWIAEQPEDDVPDTGGEDGAAPAPGAE
jgi:DNA gyrase subunit A